QRKQRASAPHPPTRSWVAPATEAPLPPDLPPGLLGGQTVRPEIPARRGALRHALSCSAEKSPFGDRSSSDPSPTGRSVHTRPVWQTPIRSLAERKQQPKHLPKQRTHACRYRSPAWSACRQPSPVVTPHCEGYSRTSTQLLHWRPSSHP